MKKHINPGSTNNSLYLYEWGYCDTAFWDCMSKIRAYSGVPLVYMGLVYGCTYGYNHCG